ncbi:hypothetical protein NL676_018137 [Syzygium grande]|nr:hypothetical protein NL676_018137 [Syzygium grande]
MATKGLVVYLISGFALAIVSAFFLANETREDAEPSALVSLRSTLRGSDTEKVWPKLEFGWRVVVATVIGFLGSACGAVGGIGGGGIFVPMLTLIVGFDTKSAAAISKCMIMGASAASVCPCSCLGITVGVALSVVFPYWLITVLIIILFLGTSLRSFFKGLEMWKEETILKKELTQQQETLVNSRGELLIDTQYDLLIPTEEKTELQILCLNLRWKRTLILVLVWVAFLLLQVIKNDLVVCSAWYWVLFCLQLPIAIAVFGYEAVKLYREHKKRMCTGNTEAICEATIQWTALHIMFCALCGILGGCVGGLLGSGGGFILGPLLLEIGVIPQVASATATFVMVFSSSLSVVEFYLLKRFPIPYALYLMSVSILAGFWGQYFIRKLITFLGRASLIVFILSGVIFASALTMGVVGIEKSIVMIENHEFMGFLSFCSSQ